ncbi:MAG: helix-turn-helix domain-containing protein [Rhodobacteraceae bacterium]|nr:helix-turn-helix domain-containing protein [Paracoccaceae bacterium]
MPPSEIIPVYKSVSASLRALEVLEALNDMGPSGLTAVHRRTGLPKATALRMLETLRTAGFATYDPVAKTFAVGIRALSLSHGYRPADEVVSVARPIVAGLRTDLGWPSDVVVCQNDQLVIADTNTATAVFSIVRRRGPGSHLPFSISATGRTWLAFCGEEQRERILRFEHPHPHESLDLMANPDRLRALTDETRRRGYGLVSGEYFDGEAGAAVPVMMDGVLVCCLNIITARNAVPAEQIEARYVPRLLDAARAIEARVLAARPAQEAAT